VVEKVELILLKRRLHWAIITLVWVVQHYGNSGVFVVDYVEPATNAPFHVEDDDLKMIDNDERLAVSYHNSTVIYHDILFNFHQ